MRHPYCIKIAMDQQIQMLKNINLGLCDKESQRITKNSFDLHIVYRRTAIGQQDVSVSGAKLWNTFPINIRNSNTIATLKNHM